MVIIFAQVYVICAISKCNAFISIRREQVWVVDIVVVVVDDDFDVDDPGKGE